jgi:cell surface protein SprA
LQKLFSDLYFPDDLNLYRPMRLVMNRVSLLLTLTSTIVLFALDLTGNTPPLDDPYAPKYVEVPADTIPEIQDRDGDYITTPPSDNPFDLQDPSAIEQTIEYDPITDQYIITEKIGEEFYRPSSFMSFEEYLEYNQKKQERDYFNQLAGVSTGDDNTSALDPIAKFDVENSVIDRLFGGTTVDIRPQGSIDLTFGVDFQNVENPILTERQRRQGGFDFDMNIQMNVTGKIGEKLNLTTNYNTNATFNFDNQIKLDYNSDLFSEDEIIKKIEAGNVSLPLRGSLIQGAQSLFGLKTEMQFGHLRLTAIASQQQSQRENLQIQGGSQLQEFEVKADEYDENRHFFLSHYNRDVFEVSLSNMPQVKGLFKIENIEVWITNDRNEVENVRDIVALADLGEPERFTNPNTEPFPTPRYQEICDGKPLPDNEANNLYQELIANDAIREIDQAVSILQSSQFGLQQSRDFEKVSARRLKPSEYTFHPGLGFISVNVNVQPDQVLGVAFQYSYNGETFKVGELSINSGNVGTDVDNPTPEVLFVKMLKSTTQRIDLPTWDLMMKNVYSIGAFQVNQEDFKLDVFYEDPGNGIKRFLPESNLAGRPLLRVFNLDNLNVLGDPQPDGIFDFVPGITINPRNGRIMFPVLEPFGSSLAAQIDDQQFRDKYVYQELYDQTIFNAREFPEKNRFTIKGSYKSSVSAEISLGAFNIPPGSVRVSAGGQVLREGADYEVDYNIGRVKILNDAILNSGVPVNVSFEDNTLFGFQSKTMLGLRADYEVGENFNIGATYLHLFERPFTQKVNVGDDPINNKIYGLDINLTEDAPFLTKFVDAIPLLSTKEPSSISFSAEAAWLKPGHARAINEGRRDKDGVVYVDDFEGSASSFDLRTPVNNWYLASVPQNDAANNNPLFPEANEVNNLVSGANRALLNWYRIDPSVRSNEDDDNPYTSPVPQIEVFPNLQLTPDQLPNIQTLDLHYQPQERGPYNFDVPNGGYPGFTQGVILEDDNVKLVDPETRWGGVMRALNTNDFQSANIEFLEFWMLSPFEDPNSPMDPNPDRDEMQGDLYINLGNISEDILRDSRKFFENGLPGPANPNRRTDTTNWSVVPIAQQITNAFDNDPATRELQDVGLDGLSDDGEREIFGSYIDELRASNPNIAALIEQDPSNDNFRYYRDQSFPDQAGVYERYSDFNNQEGNSQANQGGPFVSSATNIPDSEDLNRDNTLNENESYFQYRIPMRYNPADPREIDVNATPYITDRRVSGDGERVWYRFKIPLDDPNRVSVGGIQDFRSIRFIRMYMHGFAKPVTLRFARFELVRNQWRRYRQDLGTDCEIPTAFDVNAVNIEENSSREPFNYVLPEGIQREQSLGVFNALQNEQSLALNVQGLCDGDARAIFKIINMDMRVYERLKMFVHAEELDQQEVINPGDLSIFIRLGSDFKNNYYEYEIPLTMSDEANLPANPNDVEYKQAVWPLVNEFDFPLELLKDVKIERNEAGFSLGDEFVRLLDPTNQTLSHQVKVAGNPSLGLVKVAMIGVRNRTLEEGANVEVWVNEMRLTGLDERGGVAANARLDMQLADFGNVTVAGNYSSIGFGALDQKLIDRNREEIVGYDLATNLELGKFFPDEWGLRVPFYAQYSNITKTPEYDPYDLDIPLKEKLANAEDARTRDSLKVQAQDVQTIKGFNFTNVRKEKTNSSKPSKPWDISNFSATYSYTETDQRDPIIEMDEEKRYSGILDYSWSRRANYIEPFKNIKKDKYIKLLTAFNFNPLPNSFSFSSALDRTFATTKYRFTGLEDRFNTFFKKRFTWGRDYDLQWDLTKSLKLNYNAVNTAYVDEPDEIWMLENLQPNEIQDFRRDSIINNLRDFGRTKNYRHNLSASYELPIRYLPFMDWTKVKLQYQADYSWTAAALNTDSLGNVIQNGQSRQINIDFNFENLYNKVGYLKKINRGKRPKRNTRGRASSRNNDKKDDDKDKDEDKNSRKKKKGNSEPSDLERALIRPLMLLRKARVNYSEQFRTVVPGFTPQAKLLGLSSGFDAPGLDFAFGIQPKIRELTEAERNQPGDWLFDNKEWITNNVFLNQEVIQEYTQDFDGRLTLEPFADFRIDVEARRSFTENHTEYFKNVSKDQEQFGHFIPKDVGSLTVSYFALNTLFQDKNSEILDLFRTFEQNRLTISQRIGTGTHSDPILSDQGFTDGYGSKQQDVLIPAFIAAYTGEDPNAVGLDVFDIVPKLNWRLTYNGLNKVPLFKDIFQNFSLTHSYNSTLTINRFNTGLDYLRTVDNGARNELNGDFYARLEIPEIAIQESFAPFIALDMTLNNGMSMNIDYKKARTLALSFINNQLNETQTKEIAIGFGYLMKDVDIPFLTGSKKKKGRGKKKKEEEEQQQNNRNNRNNRGGGRNQLEGKDLDINFNFSLRDDVTFAHIIDAQQSEPTRGTYSLSLSPSAEYKLNQRLSLRLFFDYRRNVPKTSAGFPRTDTSGGVVVRFQLN